MATILSNVFEAVVAPVALSDTPDYADPLAGVSLLGGRITLNAANDAQLAAHITTANNNPGNGYTIQLAQNTTYSSQYTIDCTRPANNPVIIKGWPDFSSKITNTWTVEGSRNIITSLMFDGTNAKIGLTGTENHIIGNKFTSWGNTTQTSAHAITFRVSFWNEVAYNELYEPTAANPPGTNNLRMGIRTADRGVGSTTQSDMPEDAWVHHNLFRDFPNRPTPGTYSSGQTDAFEWGQTTIRSWQPSFNSGLYFESNMILRHAQTGGATVDMKVGGFVARYNTFIDSPGRLDLRGPTGQGFTPGAVYESNYFDADSGGATIHGRGVELIGNAFLGGKLTLRAGSTECDAVPATSNDHNRTCSNFVAGNEGSLDVGEFAGAGSSLPATGTVIEQHTGSITLDDHVNTTDNRNDPTAVNFIPPVALTESQVGPAGLSLATSAYKNARGL